MRRRPNLHRLLACALGLLAAGLGPTGAQTVTPNIPIEFSLPADAEVTIVIEDATGQRVRNLIGGAFYPAGTHTFLWDGYDEGVALAAEGYDIERSLVPAGSYTVRLLTHDGIALETAVRVNTEGNPPWKSLDGSGGWLADHAPPHDLVFLPDGSPFDPAPQIFVGSPTDETGHGNVWLDTAGNKLFGFRQGGFVAPWAAARDVAAGASPIHHLYRLSPRNGEVNIAGYTDSGTVTTLYTEVFPNAAAYTRTSGISLAVHSGIAVFSLPHDDVIRFVDLASGTLLNSTSLTNPRGLHVDTAGNLLAVVAGEVRRYTVDWGAGLPSGETVVATTPLEDPFRLIQDGNGRLFVSDHGASHQVKVFDAAGAWLYSIGNANSADADFGLYDERSMHFPGGMAIDDQGRLWVAEISPNPKRVSLWQLDGTFVRGFYGPGPYGGGGYLDPVDTSRFYYATDAAQMTLQELQLDWQNDVSKPRAIWDLRAGLDPAMTLPEKRGNPETPIHVGGRVYLSDSYMHNHCFSRPRSMLWLYGDGTAPPRLAAIVGRGTGWGELLRSDVQAVWSGLGLTNNTLYFVWSDENLNGYADVDEFQFTQASTATGRQAINSDLSLLHANGDYVPPPTILPNGIPVWDLQQFGRRFINAAANGDVLQSESGWSVVGGGPFYGYDAAGTERWIYHSQNGQFGTAGGPARWPGDIGAGTGRMIGFSAAPTTGEAGELWLINGRNGEMFLFTVDGFFVDELGAHDALAPLLRTNSYSTGQLVQDVSFKDEHFWPAGLTVGPDGSLYVVAGKEFSEVFRIVGLDSIARPGAFNVDVTAEQQNGKPNTLVVPSRGVDPVQQVVELSDDAIDVDGDLNEWTADQFYVVDVNRGIEAAVELAVDRVYLAFKTQDPELLSNAATGGFEELFATGGGLDLFVRTDSADLDNPSVVGGDFRVFITRTGDPAVTTAARYQQVATWAGGGDSYTYRSPANELTFESVADISLDVELEQNGGDYEVSLPLSVLGSLLPADGGSTRADIGVVIGDGFEPQARLYLNNKFSVSTSDVPTEASLTPEFWGFWNFSGTLPQLVLEELIEEFVTGTTAELFVHDTGVSTKLPRTTDGSGSTWAAASPFSGNLRRSIDLRDSSTAGEHDYIFVDKKLMVPGTYVWGRFGRPVDLSATDAGIVYEQFWPTGRSQPSAGVVVRYLLQLEESGGERWYLSSPTSPPDVVSEGDVGILETPLSQLSWEQVDSAVATNLDDMTEGLTTPMATVAGTPSDFSRVLGGGVLVDSYQSLNNGYYIYGLRWAGRCVPTPAAPEDAPQLTLAKSGSDAELAWSGVADATAYDVVTGSVAELRAASGDYAVQTVGCAADDLTATGLSWVGTPAVGEAEWVLVRPINCGGAGSFDAVGGVAPSRDAGLNAATGGCP